MAAFEIAGDIGYRKTRKVLGWFDKLDKWQLLVEGSK